jgi:hypothetical protein
LVTVTAKLQGKSWHSARECCAAGARLAVDAQALDALHPQQAQLIQCVTVAQQLAFAVLALQLRGRRETE